MAATLKEMVKKAPAIKSNKFVQGETNYNEWRDHNKDNKRYLSRMAVINMMIAKKNAGEKLTLADEIMLVQQIVVSSLSDKMEDFFAISTSVLMNARCQARARVKGSICKSCYAASNLNRFSALLQATETNFIILNNFDISLEAWATLSIPTINCRARIESHGDTASATCAANYCKIVNSHAWITFGVWTKNPYDYKPFFVEHGKPGNMIFILSSIYENVVAEIPEDMKKFVDHVFTVYTEEYVLEHGIAINCGKYHGIEKIDHKCKNCMRCYTPGTEFYISELKK